MQDTVFFKILGQGSVMISPGAKTVGLPSNGLGALVVRVYVEGETGLWSTGLFGHTAVEAAIGSPELTPGHST